MCDFDGFLSKEDFDCIGLVSSKCNNEHLCIASNEAVLFDVMPLMCNPSWFEVSTLEDEVLLGGGCYEGCNGETKHNIGLRKMVVYFAYARYVHSSNYSDTPSGIRIHGEESAIPPTYSELKGLSNKYRDQAIVAWESLQSYLCSTGQGDCKNECGNSSCSSSSCESKININIENIG